VRRPVAFKITTIRWDGEEFSFTERGGVLKPRTEEIALAE